MAASVGIVATVREPVWIIESFLRYHLQRGFAHIFLFFDDPLDPAIEVARRYQNVSAIPGDAELLDKQSQCRCFPNVAPFKHEIMARQILNAEIALELAAQIGLDWLLHIDGDELFYTSGNVSEHFTFLPASVGMVSYRNFEGIPETWDTRDYFCEVTLFKKHEHLLPPGATATYCQKLNRSYYLLGYGNGKSATRVLPGVVPQGVHLFATVPSHPDVITCPGGPIILHYINCGFNSYCHKYQRLGSNSWLGVPIPFEFYLQSRSVTGDPVGLADLYGREVYVENQRAVQDLISHGILMRITEPSDVLGAKLLVPSRTKTPAESRRHQNITIPDTGTSVSIDEHAQHGSRIALAEVASSGLPSKAKSLMNSDWEALRSEYPWPAEQPAVIPERDHGWMRTSISELLARHLSDQTRLVVELGSWLGLSTRFILQTAPAAGVIAIDHWLGSPEHYRMPEAAKLLPQLFETFQVNCWESQDRLLPLRMGTLEGLNLVAQRGLRPDLIYIDADHSYEAVKADLETCLDQFPGAIVVGDDWDWAEVRRAVEDVCRARKIEFDIHGFGWTIRRMSAASSVI